MKTSASVSLLLVSLFVPVAVDAATIRVPADAPTIQQAVDAAVAGDIVLVSPGTYVENINFRGKAITVESEQGPEVTIIDGNGTGSVVTFAGRETRSAVLRRFTIRNGASSSGGGVLIHTSSPSIVGNKIVNNGACSGAGVYSYFSSPLIQGNTISRNFVYACSGASGLGVYIGGDSAAELIDNVITENSGYANGGGVTLFAAGRAVLRGNVIARNLTSGFSPCTSGGGIWMVNFSQATIVNNLVVGNAAGCGGGFYWGASSGVTTLVNNTFADNDGAQGSAIAVSGVDSRHVIHNNVIVGKAGQTALYCSNSSSTSSPVVNSSNVFTPQGVAYGGTCLDQTGQRGNISADALFARPPFGDVPGDYRLHGASPAIDAGNNAAPLLAAVDLDGNGRIFDGNADGVASVDMGSYEYTVTNRPPVANAGPDQVVASEPSCGARVTLDGSASSDPDGEPVRYVWTGSFGTAFGAAPVVTLAPGTHVVTLRVFDIHGASASDSLTVTVEDRTPPSIASAAATPSVLSSPNRQFVAVAVSVSASDGCGGTVRCRITAVTSNEPVDEIDWMITGDLTLNLRAERDNRGTGRIYTITVLCTDAAGNDATTTVTVTVPRK
jgi:hypothetical protein